MPGLRASGLSAWIIDWSLFYRMFVLISLLEDINCHNEIRTELCCSFFYRLTFMLRV